MKNAGSVEEFMRGLEHPRKADMELVCGLIRGADPAIEDGIKWNAPSFRVGEYFATVNTRDQDRASVKFRDRNEIERNGPAFQSIVREWIAHLK